MFVGESDYYSGIDNITNLGEQYSLDLEITQDLGTMQLTLGAENITDEYPDDDTGVTCCGAIYPEFAPLGFMGAFYYLRLGMDF